MYITKETTLKGIRVSDVKINNCIFTNQRSDTFCTAHVHYIVTKSQPLEMTHILDVWYHSHNLK